MKYIILFHKELSIFKNHNFELAKMSMLYIALMEIANCRSYTH